MSSIFNHPRFYLDTAARMSVVFSVVFILFLVLEGWLW